MSKTLTINQTSSRIATALYSRFKAPKIISGVSIAARKQATGARWIGAKQNVVVRCGRKLFRGTYRCIKARFTRTIWLLAYR